MNSAKPDMTRYVYGADPEDAALWANGADTSYPTLEDARNSHEATTGDRLFRVDVTEIPMPEPTWWWCRGNVWSDIVATENQIPTGVEYATLSNRNGPNFNAVVRAMDEYDAIDKARRLWRDLAKQIGGEE